MLDTRLQVQTPEGIELALTPAGLLPRCLACIVDYIIIIVASIVITLVLSFAFQELAAGPLMILWFAAKWLYDILFEVFNDGKTPGKAVMDIKVVNSDGSPINFTSSMLRNLLRVVDMFPAFYLVGGISTMFTKTFQRIGDIVAGTYVVYVEPSRAVIQIEHPEERPLRLNLKAKEHQAIMLLEERLSDLSEERRDEIAGLLGEHIDGSPRQIYEKLRAHARWLVGAG